MSIQFSSSIWIFLFLAVAAILFSIYSYKHTIPEIPRWKKYLLATLRATALVLILILFFEPTITLNQKEERKTKIGVLVDNSTSMAIGNNAKNKIEEINQIISKLQNGFDDDEIFFSTLSNQNISPDSIIFNYGVTDLNSGLKNILNSNDETPHAVILLSDGNHNSGEEPLNQAENSNLPIIAIGFGDTNKTTDVVLKKIKSNSTIFVGNKTEIEANIFAEGAQNKETEINFYENERLIETKKINFGLNENHNIKFIYQPKSEGEKFLTIKTKPIRGELTEKNNSVSTSINILKKKKQILILTSSVSADVSAISQSIKNYENTHCEVFISLPNGEVKGISPNTNFEKYFLETDVLFLIGFPAQNQTEAVEKLATELKLRNLPILFIPSRTIDLAQLKKLEQFLPFTISNETGSEQEIFFEPNLENEIFINTDANFWKSLPPLFSSTNNFKIKPEASSLGEMVMQNIELGTPMIASRNILNSRSIAFFGYGIWRWRLQNENKNFDIWIQNLISWLSTKQNERVTVKTTKKYFSAGEKVEFLGEVYSESNQPFDDAELQMKIVKDKNETNIFFDGIGSGRYESTAPQLEEGEYNYFATAKSNNKIIGTSVGKFSVGESSIEFLETKQNISLLKQIAKFSGGEYVDAKNFEAILPKLKEEFKSKTETIIHKKEITFLNFKIGILIILLFASEWFWRKQIGML